MSSILMGSGYSVKKGGLAAAEGGRTISLNLLVQGRLDAYISAPFKCFPVSAENLRSQCYRLFDLGQNIFIGVNDLLGSGNNSLTMIAASDCGMYSYEAENGQGAMTVINNQRGYGAYAINSLCILIENSVKALHKLNAYRKTIENILFNLCTFHMSITEEYGLEPAAGQISGTGAPGLAMFKEKNIKPPVFFVKQFIESDNSGRVCPPDEKPETHKKIDYYIHMLQIPPEIKKSFFGADKYIACAHIEDASACLDTVLAELRQSIGTLEGIIELIYSDKAESIYNAFVKTAYEMKNKGLDFSPATNAASYVIEKVKDISAYIEAEYGHYAGIDLKYAEHTHFTAMSSLENKCAADSVTQVTSGGGPNQSLPEELSGSAEKILQYSGISEEKATCFMMNLTAFRNLKDRLSADNSAKQIRGALTDLYFEIYPAVFKKSCVAKDNSRLIRMFLDFGYMDEKLLDNNQVMDIYRLAGSDHSSGVQNIHYMNEWFEMVYSMEKNPSVSHFGLDYAETFRELKKNGVLTDKDKTSYFMNRDDRLAFETDNMFRHNHKACHGHISTYMPILHRDMAPQNPIRAHVSPVRIKERIDRILEIDFSAFHREVNYLDTSKGIEKELVMMQVIPDIILVPVYGSRAMMWQEISGKVKTTPGRLLLPVFTDENLDEMILKLVGNFRWELCRTMMGFAWNDITQSSLTSEYSDYIESYRKNIDLSEDAKDKIKALKSRFYNKLRDIFTSDYETWVNYESKGNPRLNKVARAIFLKYCPFSKAIREQLEMQPIYSESLAIFKNQRAKHARELENHYKLYTKLNVPLDPVLQKNLEFYRDL